MSANPTDPAAVAWNAAYDGFFPGDGTGSKEKAVAAIASYGDQRVEAALKDARDNLTLSVALLSEAEDVVSGQAARIAELEARVEVLVDVGNALAFAAGALNLATDGLPLLRGERVNVLDALKDWGTALNPSARSE